VEPGFWLQRWQESRIGFHQAEVNALLQRFWPEVGVAPGAEVLVPLCGKSLDMRWLCRRHRVLGVELSPVAIEAFFREAGLEPVRRDEGRFSVYEAERLRLLCGDFFDLRPEQLLAVRGVYDRASLIAFPADMRRSFVSRLTELLLPDTGMLLVTLDYDRQDMQGPPFAVDEDEVRLLFEPHWSVQRLHAQDILAAEPRFRERGLSRLEESVYRLRRGAG
jgi:thiopurine S-methyltransferase